MTPSFSFIWTLLFLKREETPYRLLDRSFLQRVEHLFCSFKTEGESTWWVRTLALRWHDSVSAKFYAAATIGSTLAPYRRPH